VPSKYTRRFHQLLYIEEEMVCVLRPFSRFEIRFCKASRRQGTQNFKGIKKRPFSYIRNYDFKKKKLLANKKGVKM
jgi:hypothetical protein